MTIVRIKDDFEDTNPQGYPWNHDYPITHDVAVKQEADW